MDNAHKADQDRCQSPGRCTRAWIDYRRLLPLLTSMCGHTRQSSWRQSMRLSWARVAARGSRRVAGGQQGHREVTAGGEINAQRGYCKLNDPCVKSTTNAHPAAHHRKPNLSPVPLQVSECLQPQLPSIPYQSGYPHLTPDPAVPAPLRWRCAQSASQRRHCAAPLQ